ncbi:MAG: exodeoxyribonuclease V subunit gamma [Rhodanobacteraceae bacterium]|nr:MAG: exodeoxyribonuclease V subunit gamma [Rhodanobacteraceae bacterium]
MFQLVTSNNTATLADALGERLGARHGNPLLPARVLVPQAGLRRWLQVHLAGRLGVIANVEFTPPAQFAWELLRAAQPGLPRQSPFDVPVLRWHLHALLGAPLEGAALEPLRAYLAGGDDPLRRYALSLELARVYERMQGYRRAKLLSWQRGGDADDWQAELWRRLLPRVGGSSRAAQVDAWLRAFDPGSGVDGSTEKPAPPGLPEHFACFACANVSPDVLRMLAIAGRHCDVDFYLPLPSREYLGDAPQSRRAVYAALQGKQDGNPLIVQQGGALAATVELLYSYQQVQPDAETEAFDAAIDGATLLGRVRNDILHHAAPAPERRVVDADDSLQFHACHTPLREVETLHDTLLALLQHDATLQPRGIAVMLPDVAAYAPAIRAVFGGIERSDPRWIPFNLGDAGAATLHPVVQLFQKLLEAPASRWEVGEILDVLAVPGVQRHFDLDADALERLGRRLREAGVRWGEDEHARAGCGDYREFSFAFGIDRLLAGFACGDASADLVGGTAPLAGVEGAAFTHLDAVLGVTASWRRLRAQSQHAQTATHWQRFLNETLDSLYQADPHDSVEARALERIRAALAALANACADADPSLLLTWAELRAFLRDTLAGADPQQHLFTGGVTFCGMVPLRVVPFRVICLLGMDEAAFPRREANGLDPLLGDRRAGTSQPGDRDVRADDRLLFLQLLAATRDVFYVSWTGRDAHTNEERPPSVVVSELLDVVREYYLVPPADDAARARRDARLPQTEPLHPFDRRLFAADADAARSFHAEWRPAANAAAYGTQAQAPFASIALPPPPAAAAVVELDALRRFFSDPARGFLEHALHLRLPHDAEADADLEPLQPNAALLRYGLASTLLAHGDTDAAREQRRLRAQGLLPPGALADAALAIARTRAGHLRAAIAEFTGRAARVEGVAQTLTLTDGTQLAGTVTDVYPAGLVRATAGKLNGKRVLCARIDMLFATIAAGAPVACRLLWMEADDKVAQRDLAAVPPADAAGQLAALVAAMRSGCSRPLPLFAKASWDALKRWRVRAGEAGLDEFIETFCDLAGRSDADAHDSRSEFRQPAARIAWRGVDLTAPDDALQRQLYAAATSLFPKLLPVTAGSGR